MPAATNLLFLLPSWLTSLLVGASRKARRARTGMAAAREGMRQVADAATQTASRPATPGGAAQWGAGRAGTAEEQHQQGQAAMYGVNAAVATAKSSLVGEQLACRPCQG